MCLRFHLTSVMRVKHNVQSIGWKHQYFDEINMSFSIITSQINHNKTRNIDFEVFFNMVERNRQCVTRTEMPKQSVISLIL